LNFWKPQLAAAAHLETLPNVGEYSIRQFSVSMIHDPGAFLTSAMLHCKLTLKINE
jgi:hypothetical protein